MENEPVYSNLLQDNILSSVIEEPFITENSESRKRKIEPENDDEVDEASDNDDEEEGEDNDEKEDSETSDNSKKSEELSSKSTKTQKKRKLSRKARNRRKNISTVLKDAELDKLTQNAKNLEAERLKRLQELQMRARLEQQYAMERQRQAWERHQLQQQHQLRVNNLNKHKTAVINLISSSSDENESPQVKREGSDSDDIKVLPETEDDAEDDPDNSGMHVNDKYNTCDENGRVLINVGHPDNDPDVFLLPQLSRVVKPHQIGGIRFLYDNIIESLSRYDSVGYGCILAHSMGLGKTIQVVSFTEIFLRFTPGKTALIIVPINTIQNWLNEFNQWIPKESKEGIIPRSFDVFVMGDNCKNLDQRAKLVESWSKSGGVLLMGYELYRQLANKKPRKRKPKKVPIGPECIDIEEEDKEKLHLDKIQAALVDPGPDLVICDEGHRIKNAHASTSMALKSVKTMRRVVLTGYPLQNNLVEYWCMVDFVRPNYLGNKSEFSNMFERPIQNGLCADSMPKDIRLMKHRAHVLHNQLKGFVQRRSAKVLLNSLPPREEFVLLVRMTKLQRDLYRTFMEDYTTSGQITNPLKAFAVCCKIYNHPDVLYNFIKRKEESANGDFDLEFDEFGQEVGVKKGKGKKNSLKTPSQPLPLEDVNGFNPFGLSASKKDEINYDWAQPLIQEYTPGLIENSAKLQVFMCILEETIKAGDRILLFSQSLLSLNLIEQYLKESACGNIDWIPGSSYYRLDGSTSGVEREKLIKSFNANENIKLFLVSTRAGSLGINLIGANRVVIFDASWNPCHDSQAVCRVYRYGQQKTSYIYRLVTDNSLEKKIYDRQINKQSISNRIVDELNPESRFQTKEMATLVVDNEEDPPEVELKPPVTPYVDNVLNILVSSHSVLLTTLPFPHDSLLLDRRDTKLSKAEKRLAERSYQIEKGTRASNARFSYSNFYPRQNGPYPSSSSSAVSQLPRSIDPNYNPRFPLHRSWGPIRNPPDASRPIASVRPMYSNTPPTTGNKFPTEALAKQGVSIKHLTMPYDILIPTNNPETESISLKKGQTVMVIKTPKGIYIRMGEQIIKIRLPANLLGELIGPSKPAEVVTLSDSDSEPTEGGPIQGLYSMINNTIMEKPI